MNPKTKKPLKNQLAWFRQKRALELKQVAVLLGHKGLQQISRYENGVKIPNLKTALKLAQIYRIPIRILLDGYYETCLSEIRQEATRLSRNPVTGDVGIADQASIMEFCSIEEKLLAPKAASALINKARRHSADLIRRTAEKLGHI